ncbi:MAG: hypothetical protein AAB229_07650 [Candidatus Hydrogenedentota bacterium]
MRICSWPTRRQIRPAAMLLVLSYFLGTLMASRRMISLVFRTSAMVIVNGDRNDRAVRVSNLAWNSPPGLLRMNGVGQGASSQSTGMSILHEGSHSPSSALRSVTSQRLEQAANDRVRYSVPLHAPDRVSGDIGIDLSHADSRADGRRPVDGGQSLRIQSVCGCGGQT